MTDEKILDHIEFLNKAYVHELSVKKHILLFAMLPPTISLILLFCNIRHPFIHIALFQASFMIALLKSVVNDAVSIKTMKESNKLEGEYHKKRMAQFDKYRKEVGAWTKSLHIHKPGNASDV